MARADPTSDLAWHIRLNRVCPCSAGMGHKWTYVGVLDNGMPGWTCENCFSTWNLTDQEIDQWERLIAEGAVTTDGVPL